jgi:hypothetical protein
MTEDEYFWEYFWQCDFGGEDPISSWHEWVQRQNELIDDRTWEEADPLGHGLYQWAWAAAEAEQPRLLKEYGCQEDLDNPDKLIIEPVLHEMTEVWRALDQRGCTYLMHEFCRLMREEGRRGAPQNILLDAEIMALDRNPDRPKLLAACQDIADKLNKECKIHGRRLITASTVAQRRKELHRKYKEARAAANKRVKRMWKGRKNRRVNPPRNFSTTPICGD